jgi:hypothetical protein
MGGLNLLLHHAAVICQPGLDFSSMARMSYRILLRKGNPRVQGFTHDAVAQDECLTRRVPRPALHGIADIGSGQQTRVRIKEHKMFKTLKRIGLILATSSGIIAATTLTAHAGIDLANHCEPRFQH